MATGKMSPMMEHYLKMKEEYKGCILFYRLGDFYEMFFEDAILVSKELELTLTGRDCGLSERAPMCGVPFHAADLYITRLIEKGYRVAVCEQVEDPKYAKGLVERKVIRIVTPGTNLSVQSLEDGKNNYLMCVSASSDYFGIAVADISTGEFLTTEVDDFQKIIDEIYKFQPSEIIYQKSLEQQGYSLDEICERMDITKSVSPEHYFDSDHDSDCLKRQMKVGSLDGLGLADHPYAITASGALLSYILDTMMDASSQINSIHLYSVSNYMILDSSTRRNLELCETMRDKSKRGSLLWVLDKTKTAMGARLLRKYVEQPLLSKSSIEERLDAVETLNQNMMDRDELREYLSAIYDLERLMTRISIKTANPRDLLSFKTSISYLPYIRNVIANLEGKLFKGIYEDFDTLEDICEILEQAIDEDAPLTVKEGNIFKKGYSETIDAFKERMTNAKAELAGLEEKERQASGIKTLKVKFNKVFGYYIEVTNSFKNMVPDYFIRKQTLTNAERFTTDELNELSDLILNAEDRLFALEYETYTELRDRLSEQIRRVQKMADYVAKIDVYSSLSYVAVKNHYVRPEINEEGLIQIQNGRHPVVELNIPSGSFVPNDTHLDNALNRISIITGPNMAGKSTYMRQTALICLMAQLGSFVPCDSANICLSDRIFTRVGASDDLAQGQSTFMVEMSEVANILRNATRNSLIILDEIGRGTSTFDGLSIAWSVVEYIADADVLGAKTLFATHYHELTELEGKMSSVNNYCIAIKQDGDHISFLRKIVKGGADRSYGIEVAKLAGVPDVVIDRAKEIAAELDEQDITGNAKNIEVKSPKKNRTDSEEKKTKSGRGKKDQADLSGQLSLFATSEDMNIAAELRALDLNNMTPIKAMLYLEELKNRLTK